MFTLEDSHTINGADGGTSVNSSVSESWYDGGFDSNYSVMYGTDTPTNDVLSFVETDSNGDTGVSTESTTARTQQGHAAHSEIFRLTQGGQTYFQVCSCRPKDPARTCSAF